MNYTSSLLFFLKSQICQDLRQYSKYVTSNAWSIFYSKSHCLNYQLSSQATFFVHITGFLDNAIYPTEWPWPDTSSLSLTPALLRQPVSLWTTLPAWFSMASESTCVKPTELHLPQLPLPFTNSSPWELFPVGCYPCHSSGYLEKRDN